MADAPLSLDEIENRLPDVPGWGLVEGRLHRELEFANFVEAFGFMSMVALVAERLDHHPDWSNSWNRVVVDIRSHAAGGVTERCFDLAARVNRALGE
jgi:4a-hydroxytetrahydrobiopterin dehydratase